MKALWLLVFVLGCSSSPTAPTHPIIGVWQISEPEVFMFDKHEMHYFEFFKDGFFLGQQATQKNCTGLRGEWEASESKLWLRLPFLSLEFSGTYEVDNGRLTIVGLNGGKSVWEQKDDPAVLLINQQGLCTGQEDD